MIRDSDQSKSHHIIYIDRQSGEQHIEKVYKEAALRLFYGESNLNSFLYTWLLPSLVKLPWFSRLYGYLQKIPSSAHQIAPFISEFQVDSSEFLEPVSSYHSFNDFFIRKLKREARPINSNPCNATIPADGRYYFYADIDKCPGFIVKKKKFTLEALLGDHSLAKEFQGGSMVLARLCPSDYHRFHFPCDCLPSPTHLINGWLYSVNPIALKKNIHILTQNKRTLCELRTPLFGKVIYMEIGATNVGSIQETYTPHQWQAKGAEKGYFEFGGSALVLLFAKNTIQFDSDLLEATEKGMEIRCLLGQSMGKSINAK